MHETIITQDTMTDVVPSVPAATSPAEPVEDEQQLALEICDLWTAHQNGQATVKRTKAEVKSVREQLSESLCRMKQLLA